MCSRLCKCSKAVKSLVCLFLACLLVVCFIAPPYLQAYAIVDIILSGAISSTMSALFTLSGIKFASSSDLISGIELAWSKFDTTIKQQLLDLVSLGGVVDGVLKEDTTIPFGISFITAYIKGLYKIFPVNKTSVPSLPSTSGVYSPISYRNSKIFPSFTTKIPDSVWNTISNFKYCIFYYSAYLDRWSPAIFQVSLLNSFPFATGSLSSSHFGQTTFDPNNLDFKTGSRYIIRFDEFGEISSMDFVPIYGDTSIPPYSVSPFDDRQLYACNFSTSWVHENVNYTSPPVAPGADVINPSDLGYTADKSICVDGVLTKALDDVLANNPSKDTVSIVIPADATDLVDGKLKDVVTDKELSDAIDKAIADTGSGTITGDITLPTVGELSLPARITTVFPFSIPWDISRGLAIFKAEPVAPRFELPFIVSGVINTNFVLDFTRFDPIIRLLRWGELTLFIVGLAIATRKVILW